MNEGKNITTDPTDIVRIENIIQLHVKKLNIFDSQAKLPSEKVILL